MPRKTLNQVSHTQAQPAPDDVPTLAADIRRCLESYVTGINAGGGRPVRSLFAPGATVEDPVGSTVVPAESWFADPLDPAVHIRRTTPPSVSADARSAALPFELDLPWQNGLGTVRVVDIMEFNERAEITSMRAYWSASDIRPSEE